MSTLNTPEIESDHGPMPKLATPEDMHYQGPMSPDVLGRAAVLGHDYGIAYNIAIERTVENVHGDKAGSARTNGNAAEREQLEQTIRDGQDAIRKVEAAISGIDSSDTNPGFEHGIGLEIEKTREEIRTIDSNEWGGYLDKIFDTIAPPMLRESVNKWREQKGGIENGAWLSWLSRDSTAETDAELMNFLQWHNHRIEGLQQHPEFQDTIEREAGIYTLAIKVAEDDEWLSEGAFDRTTKLLNSDKILHLVGDEFDMAMNGRAACARRFEFTQYSDIDSSEPLWLEPLVKVIEQNSWHEFNHAALGAFGSRWLNEALTEHISQVLQAERNLEKVAADNDGQVYEEERDLLAVLIDSANQLLIARADKVGIRDFTLTYSNVYSDKEAPASTLIDKLEEAFDFPILGAMSYYLNQQEQKLADSGVHSEVEREDTALRNARQLLIENPEKFKEYLPGETARAA